MLNSVTPFFIVDDLQASLEFYCSKPGFEIRYKNDFWGFGGLRNRLLPPRRGALRCVEVIDNSGYVLCFGRPL